MFFDPFPIGRILGHEGKPHEDAVPSASRQDSIDSPRNSLSLLRKRGQQADIPEFLQPAEQAQLSKRRCSIGSIAPLAAPSLDETAAGSCKVSRPYKSKLAGDRGDAVVARRDAPVVRQGDHLCHMLDGGDNRCIEPRQGRRWRPFGHSGKLHHKARGFWLPSEEGMSSNARKLSGVKLTVKAGLEHFCNRVVLVETDNKVTSVYKSFGWPVSIFKQHCWGSLVDVLSSTILLVAVHRPGKVNVRADRLSHWKQDHTNIGLNPAVFR